MFYLNSLDWLHLIRLHEFEKIKPFIPQGSNKKILEIGSGTGFMFGRLNEIYKNVFGLEVEGSSYRFKDKNIKLYDGKNIPFDNNSFDVIISSHVLEHVNDINYLLDETHRVLKNDGVSIHIIPSPTWRVLTSIFHYFALLQFSINIFFKKSRMSIKDKVQKKTLMDKLKFIFFAPQHGERGNLISEVYFFSNYFWKNIFIKQNFIISKVTGSNIIYWGNDFLRNILSLKNRKKISFVIGSSSNIFILKKTMINNKKTLVYFVTEDWYFLSHRLDLALSAIEDGFDVFLVTNVTSKKKYIESLGVKLIPVSIERGNLSIIKDFKFLLKLIKIFKHLKPHIIHNISLKPILYGTLAGKISNANIIVNTFPGLGFLKNNNLSVLKKIIRNVTIIFFSITLRMIESRIIIQNKFDLDFCKKQLKLNNLYLIKGSGVDTNQFSPKSEKNTKKIRISLVSRMLFDKGICDFVKAAQIIKLKHPKTIFSLIGKPDEGNQNSVSRDLLLKWQNEGIIEWLGFQNNIEKIWARSDIACLPTFYNEGLPKSLLEASACGVPIVSSDNPGCLEIVENNYNGLVFPQRDVFRLCEAIEYFIININERERMGKNGRKKVLEIFDIKSINKQTKKLYY